MKNIKLFEDFYDEHAALLRAKQQKKDAVFAPIDDEYAGRVESAIKQDWFERLGFKEDDKENFIMTSIQAYMDGDEPKWFVFFRNEDSFILKHYKGREKDLKHPVNGKPLKSRYFELIVTPSTTEPWPLDVEMSPHGTPVMAKGVWHLKEDE